MILSRAYKKKPIPRDKFQVIQRVGTKSGLIPVFGNKEATVFYALDCYHTYHYGKEFRRSLLASVSTGSFFRNVLLSRPLDASGVSITVSSTYFSIIFCFLRTYGSELLTKAVNTWPLWSLAAREESFSCPTWGTGRSPPTF